MNEFVFTAFTEMVFFSQRSNEGVFYHSDFRNGFFTVFSKKVFFLSYFYGFYL